MPSRYRLLAVAGALLLPVILPAQDSVQVAVETPLLADTTASAPAKRQLAAAAWVVPDTGGVITKTLLLVRAGGDTGWIALEALRPAPPRPAMAGAAVVKPGDDPELDVRLLPPKPGESAGATCTVKASETVCRRPGYQVTVLQPLPRIDVRPLDDRNVVTRLPFVYTIGSTRHRIRVPTGFITDYASVPAPFSLILPRDGEYKFSAIVHDYLYWAQPCSQKQADNFLAIAMQEDSVPAWRRNAIHTAVRLFGRFAWDANAKAKANGIPRWVPTGFAIPNHATGASLMALLHERGITDPPLAALPQQVCALGDTPRVP